MKRTYQPSKIRRKRTHGFLVRMRTRGGRSVIRARRAKDGHNKGTLRADDLYLLVGSVLAGLREFFLNGKLCVCAKKRLQIRFGHVNVTCGGFNHNFHLKIPVLSGFCISILLRTDRKYKFWAMFFLRFMINLMQKRP